MFAAIVILTCCAIWPVLLLRRKLALKKRAKLRSSNNIDLRRKVVEICELVRLTDQLVVIHRGSVGDATMFPYPDFQARLAERGKSATEQPDFEKISSMVTWLIERRWYALSLSPGHLGLHAMNADDESADFDFMPLTTSKDDAIIINKAVNAFHAYLGLPQALVVPREPNFSVKAFEPPPHKTRVYGITPSNKLAHLEAYLEDGDYRTFFDMFDGDMEHEFVLWVDHGEDDEDIPKMCERILKTGNLDASWANDDTLDLIIHFLGVVNRVTYPNDYADRDTTIIALSKILQPEYELRYCTASNGSDTAALLPLKRDEWLILEARFGDTLDNFFKRIDDNFSQFGT